MIRDLTETLHAFLTQPGLPAPLNGAEIRFDCPSDPYTLNRTTVNAFLFEVHENVELRSNEPVQRRVGDRVFLQRPPYRVTCMYLVTAWPDGDMDVPLREHRLLSQLLRLFAATPTIPDSFLAGSLVGQEPPLPMVVTQPEGMRNPAEYWAAIGNRMKPALLIAVTIAMPLFDEEDQPAVRSSGVTIDGTLYRIAGTVTDGLGIAVADAEVRVMERGRGTATSAQGTFSLPAIPPGNFTLRVTKGAVTLNKAITVPAPLGSNYDVQLP